MRRAAGALLALVLVAACGDDGGDSDEGFCRLLDTNQEHYDGVFQGFADITRKQEAHLRLAAATNDLNALREVAPGELHEPLDLLIETVAEMDAAVDELTPGDQASIDAAFADVRDDAEAIEAAGAELETFRQTRCQAPPTQRG
jgi:hypothetical protein